MAKNVHQSDKFYEMSPFLPSPYVAEVAIVCKKCLQGCFELYKYLSWCNSLHQYLILYNEVNKFSPAVPFIVKIFSPVARSKQNGSSGVKKCKNSLHQCNEVCRVSPMMTLSVKNVSISVMKCAEYHQ
jgi:hypothetical protein